MLFSFSKRLGRTRGETSSRIVKRCSLGEREFNDGGDFVDFGDRFVNVRLDFPCMCIILTGVLSLICGCNNEVECLLDASFIIFSLINGRMALVFTSGRSLDVFTDVKESVGLSSLRRRECLRNFWLPVWERGAAVKSLGKLTARRRYFARILLVKDGSLLEGEM